MRIIMAVQGVIAGQSRSLRSGTAAALHAAPTEALGWPDTQASTPSADPG